MVTALDWKITRPFVRRCKILWKIVQTVSAGCWHLLLDFFGYRGKSCSIRHRASQAVILSSNLRRLLGMITWNERAYLYWYGRHIFTGKGHMVDLGCWLGSTTISLAMGLERNRHATCRKLIHAHDEFVWRAYMDSGVKGTELEGKYRAGDSFLLEFERRTSAWRQYIKPCPGDLARGGWCGDPIEFLLIDAMKSWGAATGVVQNFFPALIPGVSIILHQDFAHWFTAWIHPIHYRFRHYFEPVYDVPSSGSMVFRLSRALPYELLKQEWSAEQFSDREIDEAFAYSLDIVSSEKRANVIAAKTMYFLHSGRIDRAREEIVQARSRGYGFKSDLAIVEQRVDEAQIRPNTIPSCSKQGKGR